MSNGEEIVLRLAMKPIPTLQRPLASFDVRTHRAVEAHAERSDVCAVPAACVVAEAMVALVVPPRKNPAERTVVVNVTSGFFWRFGGGSAWGMIGVAGLAGERASVKLYAG